MMSLKPHSLQKHREKVVNCKEKWKKLQSQQKMLSETSGRRKDADKNEQGYR